MLPLRLGEAVKSKEGGPVMIVDRVDGDLVTCIWMDADETFNREDFPLFMLMKLSDELEAQRGEASEGTV
jgi:uncharacterized protein YodC (DUF2158 family)